ncbi:MAG: replicative DNA helicase [Deltaproteobacteria bacterium]|nr:MAG: replicative DNA helicase [Deltaproteobacteria bacterium]
MAQPPASGEHLQTPRDESAERAVLGAIMLRPDLLAVLADRLKPHDFYLEQHQVIYTALLDLDAARLPIDMLLVSKRLKELDALSVAGGAAYLLELANSVPTTQNAERYAAIIREKSILRDVQGFARATLQEAGTEVEDVPGFVDTVAQRALRLSVSGSGRGARILRDVLRPAVERAQERHEAGHKGSLTGVTSGFFAVDRMTNGWQPSDLIILAARPGMGKTAFALNMLLNAAMDRRNPTPGVIFSLEMSAEQLATRLWCSTARISMEDLRRGTIEPTGWNRLFQAVEQLGRAKVFIDDTPSLPITEMMRKCRQLQHEHRIGLVIVDYLQLMTAGDVGRNTSREQVISEISRNLKALAKELSVPVIALSQLNRGVESRTDKRPMLSDLRESGAIEQDADIITFLYREDYYARKKEGEEDEEQIRPTNAPGLTEVIISKHRSGSTGTVELEFHGQYTLFTNLRRDEDAGDPGAPLPQDLRPPAPLDEGPAFAAPPPDPDGTRPPVRVEERPFVAADTGDDGDDDLPI